MRRILVCLLFALVLVCTAVSFKNVVTATGGSQPASLAFGGAPQPPQPK